MPCRGWIARGLRVGIAAASVVAVAVAAGPRAGSAASEGASDASDGVRAALLRYFQGHATGDASHMREAFLPSAHIEGVREGELSSWTLDEYCALFRGRPADDEARRARTIDFIDVSGHSAVAKATLDHGDVVFTDYFVLLEVGGQWRIANKVYFARRKSPVMSENQLVDLATLYAAAWSSQDPELLASFYAENGALSVNAGEPSVGRAAIAATASSYMEAFPDMVVRMDRVSGEGSQAVFHWTWTGTHTGPGGTGRSVHISGYEEWTLDADGRIVESKGHFDDAEYQRQLSGGEEG